ncbi:acetyl-CoA carboxylase carboxyl transferase subunit alpha [Butyrivibrio sp. ob235]|uniref:acetyl-CoA carboxylase carboxyltransferase subunit alpha n=1 Tax=Butyrivibrio sp. ob235 TaxID=1761780 RepID=UPI0008D01510|nr:acetyl-CoA carboxylase carboxyltransferase subunit alpha [Butyrivibrio sp. ob235]SEM29330.1 acetyl-CoA carboxylase carboxyl transferase subunit alpha [Butyrivibrio sp. ob235]
MIQKVLTKIDKLDAKISSLEQRAIGATKTLVKESLKAPDVLRDTREDYEAWSESEDELDKLKDMRDHFLSECENLTPDEKVFLARHPKRPHIDDFIGGLFTDFFEQKGDHLFDEDKSIYGGIARFHGIPVTVVGHMKGHTMEENMEYNFGMPCPEGYRKALRIMNQAEKFGRPIITFIDTPGAYPGLEAEEHGQGEAIAMNLAKMSQYHVPVISVVTGEGNSGGALAIGVANKVLMLENAVYSILSPEGFASILWKDAERHKEACKLMKLTADDLYEAGVADEIVKEPVGGAQRNYGEVFKNLDRVLYSTLKELMTLSPSGCKRQRLEKYRKIG